MLHAHVPRAVSTLSQSSRTATTCFSPLLPHTSLRCIAPRVLGSSAIASPRLFSTQSVSDKTHSSTSNTSLTNTVHFRQSLKSADQNSELAWDNPIPHEVWTKSETRAITIEHRTPSTPSEKLAKGAADTARFFFDNLTGYKHEGRLSPSVWLRRLIFLESIAGVPGMVAGMLRHLRSLRRLQRDHGWIHTLLEEAENERMHLLTFMRIREPGLLFRWAVLGAQGLFFNAFFVTYLISPKTCHRFVGFIEEEAVITYTRLIHDLENGLLPEWEGKPVPPLAQSYWGLEPDAKFVELIYAIRADEANHRDVNHSFADIGPDDTNPIVIQEALKAGRPLRPADE